MKTVPGPETEQGDPRVEGITRDLRETIVLLESWHGSRGSDSVRAQNMRKGDYARACETLEKLVGRSRQAGHVMRLTIGEEPVEDKRISKGPYDFLSVDSGEEIAPGESVLLKSVQELLQVQQRTRTVYLGDYRRTLEVADIAQVLGTGGKLELVEAEAHPA